MSIESPSTPLKEQRAERRLMRLRGAGIREIGKDFGFAFTISPGNDAKSEVGGIAKKRKLELTSCRSMTGSDRERSSQDGITKVVTNDLAHSELPVAKHSRDVTCQDPTYTKRDPKKSSRTTASTTAPPVCRPHAVSDVNAKLDKKAAISKSKVLDRPGSCHDVETATREDVKVAKRTQRQTASSDRQFSVDVSDQFQYRKRSDSSRQIRYSGDEQNKTSFTQDTTKHDIASSDTNHDTVANGIIQEVPSKPASQPTLVQVSGAAQPPISRRRTKPPVDDIASAPEQMSLDSDKCPTKASTIVPINSNRKALGQLNANASPAGKKQSSTESEKPRRLKTAVLPVDEPNKVKTESSAQQIQADKVSSGSTQANTKSVSTGKTSKIQPQPVPWIAQEYCDDVPTSDRHKDRKTLPTIEKAGKDCSRPAKDCDLTLLNRPSHKHIRAPRKANYRSLPAPVNDMDLDDLLNNIAILAKTKQKTIA